MRSLRGRRATVSGGGDLLGSHRCDGLLAAGAQVVRLDNSSAGHPDSVLHLKVRSDHTVILGAHPVRRP